MIKRLRYYGNVISFCVGRYTVLIHNPSWNLEKFYEKQIREFPANKYEDIDYFINFRFFIIHIYRMVK